MKINLKNYLKIIIANSIFIVLQAIISLNGDLLNLSCHKINDDIFFEEFFYYIILFNCIILSIYFLFNLLKTNIKIIFSISTLVLIACCITMNHDIFIDRVSCWSTYTYEETWKAIILFSIIPNVILAILYYLYLRKSTSH